MLVFGLKQTNNRENFLEPGDIESAMEATAAAVGDDNIQKKRWLCKPKAFTHSVVRNNV